MDSHRILISAASFLPHRIGGGEVYVYRLAKELLRRGHQVTVLTQSFGDTQRQRGTITRYEYENIPVVSYNLNSQYASQAEIFSGFGEHTLAVLEGIIEEFQPDVLHINGIKPALVDICARLGIPSVVTAHHAGIACPAGALVGLDGAFCAKPTRPEYCVRCSSYQRRPRWYTGGLIGRMPPPVYRPLGKWLDKSGIDTYVSRGLIYPWLVETLIESKRIVFDKAQCIIAPSKFMQTLLLRNGCSQEQVLLIPHGVDPLARSPLEGVGERPLRFGYIGRIDRHKGLHVLLEAAQQFGECDKLEIHVFGAAVSPWDMEYLEECKASYAGKPPLIFHGPVEQQALAEAYASIDVLVVPSLLPEAFGLVVPEAFSAGRTVIVFNSGGLPELVRDGVDGVVIAENDSQGLRIAMKKFIDTPATVLEMASHAPRVKTTREYVEEVEAVYARIMRTGTNRFSRSKVKSGRIGE